MWGGGEVGAGSPRAVGGLRVALLAFAVGRVRSPARSVPASLRSCAMGCRIRPGPCGRWQPARSAIGPRRRSRGWGADPRLRRLRGPRGALLAQRAGSIDYRGGRFSAVGSRKTMAFWGGEIGCERRACVHRSMRSVCALSDEFGPDAHRPHQSPRTPTPERRGRSHRPVPRGEGGVG